MSHNSTITYSIDDHRHRFAAWAAGRAANVIKCRFSVEQARRILEAAHLNDLLADVEKLPEPEKIDVVHRKWRQRVIAAAAAQRLTFTDGVAAKLINVYLKAGFVCAGHHTHRRVCALHPPIDSLLLQELSKQDVGGFRREWNEARKTRWSNLNSEQYETVIRHIRTALNGAPLWQVEKYWRGYQ